MTPEEAERFGKDIDRAQARIEAWEERARNIDERSSVSHKAINATLKQVLAIYEQECRRKTDEKGTIIGCGGCKNGDKTEHEYPCCICTRLEIIRIDRYEQKN